MEKEKNTMPKEKNTKVTMLTITDKDMVFITIKMGLDMKGSGSTMSTMGKESKYR